MSEDNIEKIILDAYYDIHNGQATTAPKLYAKLQKSVPMAKIKEVLADLKGKVSKKELQRDKKNYIPIATPPATWQCDLTFYTQFKSVNSGYHILLNFINTNTKFLISFPLKNKNATTIAECLKEFLLQADSVKTIQSDDGTEFKNNIFRGICTAHNIKVMFYNKSTSPLAIAIVERLNRSLRDLINDYMHKYNTNRFIDVYKDIVKSYNASKHSNTQLKPDSIEPKQEKTISEMNLLAKVAQKTGVEQSFPLGTLVKIIQERAIFEKGAKHKLSNEVYKVVEHKGNKIVIEDEKNNKQLVFPRQLKIVKKSYTNPFINANNEVNKKNELKKIQKDKNLKTQLRKLRKDGLYEIDPVKQEKLNRELKKLQ